MDFSTKPQTRNEQDIHKSSNAINKLMLLPSESQKSFQKKADENHQLHLICESQNVILSNYSDSYSEKLKTEQKIAEIDKEIQKIDTLLADANYILLNTLKKEPQKENEVGDFLKIILEKIENLIMSICKESLNDKSISVSLMSVIEIEQQIQKIIENLISNGMYPETQSELYKRTSDIDAHNEILLSFLSGFVNEAKQSQ